MNQNASRTWRDIAENPAGGITHATAPFVTDLSQSATNDNVPTPAFGGSFRDGYVVHVGGVITARVDPIPS